jgi:hypothetical protein
MSLYKSNHISLVGVWINFIPHLSSVLRDDFLLSILNDWAGGVGGGGRHMNQYISSSHPELNPCVNDTGAIIINIIKLFCTA